MAKSENNLGIYTKLHGPQLEYAERGCRTGDNDPMCFRSGVKWAAAADYLASHESMPLLIRSTKDPEGELAITYTADLIEVWFPEEEDQNEHRRWLEDWLWIQWDFYQDQGKTWEQFQRAEVNPALNAKTNYVIKNLKRVERVPVSDLTKLNGTSLIPNPQLGYARCRIPKEGSRLYKKLFTPVEVEDEDDDLLSDLADNEMEAGYFDPSSMMDEPERKMREIVHRRGQPQFRRRLIEAYGGQCAITEYDLQDALEAAHILPYSGEKSNHVCNGLLLRADIHTLFDLDLIGIDSESWTVAIAKRLRETWYEDLEGIGLSIPIDESLQPEQKALEERWNSFLQRNERE